MITEALVLANDSLQWLGTEGQLRKMSECPKDLQAYWKLGEYILNQIERSTDPVSELVTPVSRSSISFDNEP